MRARQAKPRSGPRRLLALTTVAAVTLSTLGLVVAPAGADPAPSSVSAGVARAGRPDDGVQTSLNGLVRGGEFPGALASVRGRGGRVRDYTAGVGDLASGAKVPVNGRVRVASTTKTFTATVVLQLAGEGKVELDAPIEKYLPGLVRGNGNDGSRITVRQLLQHTSGLEDYGRGLTERYPSYFDFQHRYFEPRELVDLALAYKPVFAPGQGWRYNTTGYVLLGLLVQKVTGRPVGEEITNRIITPLGLRDTYWPAVGEQTIRGPHPKGYYPKTAEPGAELADFTDMDPSMAWTSGQMISTPKDLNRFLGALLGGELLKPEVLEQMKQTVTVPGQAEWSYGLGLMKIKLSCGGYAWGHGGDIPGYETRDGVTEDGRAATIVVTAQPRTRESANQVNTAFDAALCLQK
ncbi:serine hydrolase domain-containing protein [Sphaerisporangium krabiense]|uniref:serine hydrolase domain-containing protein n=1 Tax=Sphaerisporangium krabiense TaxID=763782 RepID=UPI001EF2A7A5|nr:serine hydrolase domain-containing protein [Sphaerisporangium krabiense]